MAYNRELSQFASLVEVNNSSKRIGFSTDLNVSGIVTATRFYGSGRFLTDVFATSVETGIASDKQVLFSNNSNIEGASDFYYDNVKNNVGLGITNPTSKLHVVGNVLISGISTATTGSFTNISASNVNISGISTATTGSFTNISATSLNISGISTFGKIVLNSVGIITASSGIVTYYGDGSKLSNIVSGVGISTAGGLVGTGATTLDFRGSGISTVTVSSGIATINIIGNSGSVSISSVAPISPTNGNLWYSIEYGRTFIYYDEVALGIGSTAIWVDAAPFNINLSQLDDLQVNSLVVLNNTNLNNLNVAGISTLGTISNLNVTGISTLTNLIVGDINSSGIVTAIDFNSTSDQNLKENIQTIQNALETASQLRGVSFNWKENQKPSIGVIAQELEEILPELVSTGEIKTVNYNGIIGILIEAIKELKKEVEELKNTK